MKLISKVDKWADSKTQDQFNSFMFKFVLAPLSIIIIIVGLHYGLFSE